jgi:UDP-glucose 4-epimerase
MRILITGGFGFIGGRLAQHLQHKDRHIVLGSRNVNTPHQWLQDVEVVETQWSNYKKLEEICDGIDVVIQAAGMNAQDCAVDPVAALEINGVGTARLLKAAISQRVKRFVYLSTAHVYSACLTGKINENTCPHNLHPYATSHRAGEEVVLGGNNRGEIEGIVLRISNSFGAPAYKDVNCWMLLVNELCRQAVQSHELALNSSGLERRDFVPMTEVCRTIEFVSLGVFEGVIPQIINVGTGVSNTVLEMALLIREQFMGIYDFDLKLKRPSSSAEATGESLEYQVNLLKLTGYEASPDPRLEIERLLIFCEKAF